jgi:hypothetical protein
MYLREKIMVDLLSQLFAIALVDSTCTALYYKYNRWHSDKVIQHTIIITIM